MKKIVILNGPNLNLLGRREKTIYGEKSFEEYLIELKNQFDSVELVYFQSNDESVLIEQIQKADQEQCLGVILNPGAYGHTSIALMDAVASITVPVIEVHISNLYQREHFRHYTIITAKCKGSISGFGLNSYRLGIEALLL